MTQEKTLALYSRNMCGQDAPSRGSKRYETVTRVKWPGKKESISLNSQMPRSNGQEEEEEKKRNTRHRLLFKMGKPDMFLAYTEKCQICEL